MSTNSIWRAWLKLGEKIHVPGILKSIAVTYLERFEWAKKVQDRQSISEVTLLWSKPLETQEKVTSNTNKSQQMIHLKSHWKTGSFVTHLQYLRRTPLHCSGEPGLRGCELEGSRCWFLEYLNVTDFVNQNQEYPLQDHLDSWRIIHRPKNQSQPTLR